MGEIPSGGEGSGFINLNKHPRLLRTVVGAGLFFSSIGGVAGLTTDVEAASNASKKPAVTTESNISTWERSTDAIVAQTIVSEYMVDEEGGEPPKISNTFIDKETGCVFYFTDNFVSKSEVDLNNRNRDGVFKALSEKNNILSGAKSWFKKKENGTVIVTPENVFYFTKDFNGKTNFAHVFSKGKDNGSVKHESMDTRVYSTLKMAVDSDDDLVLKDDYKIWGKYGDNKWEAKERMIGTELGRFSKNFDEITKGENAGVWGVSRNDYDIFVTMSKSGITDPDKINPYLNSVQIIGDSKHLPALLIIVSSNDNDTFHGIHRQNVEVFKRSFEKINNADKNQTRRIVDDNGLRIITGDSPEKEIFVTFPNWNTSYGPGVMFFNEKKNSDMLDLERKSDSVLIDAISESAAIRYEKAQEMGIMLPEQLTPKISIAKTDYMVRWVKGNKGSLSDYLYRQVKYNILKFYKTNISLD